MSQLTHLTGIDVGSSVVRVAVAQIEKDKEVLESVDLEDKKAEDRVKTLTEAGRESYIAAIDVFLEKLRERKEESVDYVKNELGKFLKQTAKSDFKTTLLIGKEVENIRQDVIEIKKLIQDYMNENANVIKHRVIVKELLKKNNEKHKRQKTSNPFFISRRPNGSSKARAGVQLVMHKSINARRPKLREGKSKRAQSRSAACDHKAQRIDVGLRDLAR